MFAIWVKDYFSEDYIKLDLNPGEKILIKNQLNNLEKLGQVFSDVSNTFTIPATPHNNKAMRHYYDRDIVSSFNVNINIPAYTEVGSIPYRWGVVSINAGQLESNSANNYKIDFYSKNTQLTDLFGNDTIDRLDYNKSKVLTWNNLSQYDFINDSTNFFASLSSTTFMGGNLFTPIIGISNRDWEYGAGVTNLYDISTSTYSISNTELRYALKISNIFDGIKEKYGIEFSDGFLSTTQFNKIFMWLNNDKTTNSSYNELKINFTTGNLSDLGFNYTTYTWPLSEPNAYVKPRYRIRIYPASNDIPYNILVKKDGVTISTFEVEGGDFNSNEQLIPQELTGGYYGNIQWFVQCTESLTFDADLLLRITTPSIINTNYDRAGNAINQNIVDIFEISNAIPKMKVIDFFTGIMKEFKLIIRPIGTTSFYLDTLNAYYDSGNILNLSKITNVKLVDYKKPEVYTSIKFKYQKTDNVLGKKFRESNDPTNDEIGYGDYKAEFNLDNKRDLSIELPFENMLFERMITSQNYIYPNETTNLLFGQSSKLNGGLLEANNSKPILFYNNGTQSLGTFSVYFNFAGGTPVSVNTVINAGNTNSADLDFVTDSLNWGAEIDPWHNVTIERSLYYNYWKRWVESIYDLRQQKFNFKAILPIRYINEISLNDSLIIGSKRYRIESMTIDLTSGETSLELFIDTDVYIGIPDNL